MVSKIDLPSSIDSEDKKDDLSLERAKINDSLSIEDSPIEEVRASIPPTDDPTLPTATFRAWIWGIIFSAAISFTNQVMKTKKEKRITVLTCNSSFFGSEQIH